MLKWVDHDLSEFTKIHSNVFAMDTYYVNYIMWIGFKMYQFKKLTLVFTVVWLNVIAWPNKRILQERGYKLFLQSGSHLIIKIQMKDLKGWQIEDKTKFIVPPNNH